MYLLDLMKLLEIGISYGIAVNFVLLQADMWKKCLDCIDELLDILFEHNNIFIGENIAEDSENLANTDQVSQTL